MKYFVSIAFGTLFLIVAVKLIGVDAALATPSWSQPFAHAYPKLFLFLVQVIYIALPVAALAIAFGTILSRVVRSRALSIGLLCSTPWIAQTIWLEITGPSTVFSSMWFIALPILIAVIAGLVLGVKLFGSPSNPDQGFQNDALKVTSA
jgi:hypothetical protein